MFVNKQFKPVEQIKKFENSSNAKYQVYNAIYKFSYNFQYKREAKNFGGNSHIYIFKMVSVYFIFRCLTYSKYLHFTISVCFMFFDVFF